MASTSKVAEAAMEEVEVKEFVSVNCASVNAMESFSSKAKQAREALLVLGLPMDVVKQAVLKLHEFGNDIDALATYALKINVVPQAECIEEHLSDDMISSDEDLDEKRIHEPPTGTAAAPTVQASPKGKEPQKEEEEWQDPICKLFQEPHRFGIYDFDLNRPWCGSGSSSPVHDSVHAPEQPMGSMETEAGQFCTVKPLQMRFEPAAAAPDVVAPAPPVPPQSGAEERENTFLEMGFSRELVQRIMRQHGEGTSDAVLVQSLIDEQRNHEHKHDSPVADPLPEDTSESSDDEVMRARITSLMKGGDRSLKCRTTNNSSIAQLLDSDSDSDDAPCSAREGGRPNFGNWEVPKDTASRRAALLNLGCSPDLIARAFLELGGETNWEVLLNHCLRDGDDDLLIIGASNAATPSRADSLVRRVSTLATLTREFKYPSVAVEKAMQLNNTPLWNASQDDIADLIEFITVHIDRLIGDKEAYGSSGSEDSMLDPKGYLEDIGLGEDWNQQEAGLGKGKRKLANGRMGKGKKIAPGGRRYSFNVRGLLKKNAPKKTSTLEATNKFLGSIGFGLPGKPLVKTRYLHDDIKGAPFFYFENVAGMPQGEWHRIQTHLFDIQPEFVDAMHFSACRRARGYIHNLPVDGRQKIIPDPPMTIQELMPQTTPYWPSWDNRTKFHCINTQKASLYTLTQLGISPGTSMEDLSVEQQKVVMSWCKKFNLVWTSPTIPTPIEPNEIEVLLGFDKDHTRNMYSTTQRYKGMGNSFSVYVVGYHFSVLRALYPNGMKVLSLFSGIGGAEVALHKVGIKLNVVVSVEIEEGPRRCLQMWWTMTQQTGHLDMSFHNVEELTREVIRKLVDKYQGFDLIVGGSPCNNLTGSNRVSRTGLDGEHSTMFFEFSRIVENVREMTLRLQQQQRRG